MGVSNGFWRQPSLVALLSEPSCATAAHSTGCRTTLTLCEYRLSVQHCWADLWACNKSVSVHMWCCLHGQCPAVRKKLSATHIFTGHHCLCVCVHGGVLTDDVIAAIRGVEASHSVTAMLGDCDPTLPVRSRSRYRKLPACLMVRVHVTLTKWFDLQIASDCNTSTGGLLPTRPWQQQRAGCYQPHAQHIYNLFKVPSGRTLRGHQQPKAHRVMSRSKC